MSQLLEGREVDGGGEVGHLRFLVEVPLTSGKGQDRDIMHHYPGVFREGRLQSEGGGCECEGKG